ncbi:MAG TPA: winged helix DNA-binding domain-containing protein [Cyclobacteriaceae bacterium]|nr:winged helix DNA-binding domain-containing protein [Cyclobacteriaceae bacterium]
MNDRELLRTRLYFHKLDEPGFASPAETVRYFGAVQAQDYLGALWAVGQRTIGATEQSVEAALSDRSIVRSWPMRGTLHFTAPEDLRWMLDLLAERIFAKSATIQRDAGLTKKDLIKSRSVLEKEMAGGKILERNDLYDILKRNRIDPSNTRGLHIVGHLAREKVICFGPRTGKQSTFVLLDEWVPQKKTLTKDESLAELAWRYFTSRGPASVHDFSWWSGLTLTESARALQMVSSKLQKTDVGGVEYWTDKGITVPDKIKSTVRFLPAYDEFLVSYSDRSASEASAIKKLKTLNSIFTSTVIVNGRITSTWKRILTNKGVTIKVNHFEKTGKQNEAGIRREMKRYAKFIGTKLTIFD